MRRRRLIVYDFDDTLVKTKSFVTITTSRGEKRLNTRQFSHHKLKKNERYDFSDCEEIRDPIVVDDVWSSFVESTKRDDCVVVILTARPSSPVVKFLSNMGIDVSVISIKSPTNVNKALWINGVMSSNEFDVVDFYDDSIENVASVKSLQQKHVDKTISTYVVNDGVITEFR